MKRLVRSIFAIFALGLLPCLLLIALCARWRTRKIDIGLGPVPLINNVYHKKALATYGYRSETFVNDVYYITDEFDVRGDLIIWGRVRVLRVFFLPLYLLVRALYTYKCLYVYFNGGPLGNYPVLWRVEPVLYKLAHVKVVVMPYGGDVQELSRSANLLFKDAMARDYPIHRLRRRQIASRIDLWTRWADYIIGGCEWVDYMYYWSTLMLAHFSIDVDRWCPSDGQVSQAAPADQRKLRILHAPNHRTIKGTQFFIDAVNELVTEGLDIELVILERVPNHKVREVMASVDVVADQLVIGWYAMFALEAMAMAKPVLCYLRPDLEALYIGAGLVGVNEIPVVRCSPFTVKERIRELALHRAKLVDIGTRSRQFVLKHHSPQAVGKVFDRINRSLGVNPGAPVDHLNTPWSREEYNLVKRCVITGGSGLIGACLVASLHQQWQICAIARTRPASRLHNVEIQCIDLSKTWDTDTLPRAADAVIHLAQSEQFREFPEQAEQVLHIHTMSTLRLLDYARRAGAHTFILASSGGIYGYGAQAFSEDMPVAYRGTLEFYLGTRLCSEIIAESYTPFMSVIVLRFFFVYGPGQRRSMLMPRLVQAVIDGTPITLHGPEGICVNPTYVSDAATAIQRALDLHGSHTINIGGPEVLSLRQIGDITGKVVGKAPHFEVQPLSQPRHLVGDISKMARLLGRPQIDFETGMRTYVDSLERSA